MNLPRAAQAASAAVLQDCDAATEAAESEVFAEDTKDKRLTGADSGRASVTEFEDPVVSVELREREPNSTTPPQSNGSKEVYASRGSHTTWYLPVEDSPSPTTQVSLRECNAFSPTAAGGVQEGDAGADSSTSSSGE